MVREQPFPADQTAKRYRLIQLLAVFVPRTIDDAQKLFGTCYSALETTHGRGIGWLSAYSAGNLFQFLIHRKAIFGQGAEENNGSGAGTGYIECIKQTLAS